MAIISQSLSQINNYIIEYKFNSLLDTSTRVWLANKCQQIRCEYLTFWVNWCKFFRWIYFQGRISENKRMMLKNVYGITRVVTPREPGAFFWELWSFEWEPCGGPPKWGSIFLAAYLRKKEFVDMSIGSIRLLNTQFLFWNKF